MDYVELPFGSKAVVFNNKMSIFCNISTQHIKSFIRLLNFLFINVLKVII